MPLSWPSALSAVSRVAGRQRLAVDGDRIAVLERDLDTVGLSGAVFRIDGARIDVSRRLLRRVLEHLALGGDVQEVGVDRERRLAALVLGDRDLVLLGERRAARCSRRSSHSRQGAMILMSGSSAYSREFEAHLVVALAGRAVGDRVGADLAGDVDQVLGDQRPRDRGAEQILALVERVGAEHREHVVAHEFLAHILDEDVFGLDAEQLGLLARRLELLALAEVGGEGDDLAAIGRSAAI
jgi:hypothetical protein